MSDRRTNTRAETIPAWVNWQNSTYARTFYIERTNGTVNGGHTQLWGLDSAILVSMDGLADTPSRHSPEAHRALTTSGRIMMDPPPNASLPTMRLGGAWVIWWVRLFLVHLPLRVMVLPFDLAHHDLHHSHALEQLGAGAKDEGLD